MSVTLPRSMLMACLLSPSLSLALGLGEIHLNSSLNEPMNADIDLIAAGPDELSALRATLANREAFTRYGIDRPPFLSSLTFKVGKSKEGRDVLIVRSNDSIPEPFVTFLVEVNWARGRLMREYTVLLDPPLYTPGDRGGSAAPVNAATTTPGVVPAAKAPSSSAPASTSRGTAAAAAAADAAAAGADVAPATVRRGARAAAGRSDDAGTSGPAAGEPYRVAEGDTLTKIARSLHAGASAADIDQTMIAVYRANPEAFGGNINVLRRGAVLRIPGADDIATLNQSEALGEVHRQMDAWRSSGGAPEAAGHLRLVAPSANAGNGTAGAVQTGAVPMGAASGAAAVGAAGGGAADSQALRGRVKDLEGQLAESNRLLAIRSNELGELQRKLAANGQGASSTGAASAPTSNAAPPSAVPPKPTVTPTMPPSTAATPVPVPVPAPAATPAPDASSSAANNAAPGSSGAQSPPAAGTPAGVHPDNSSAPATALNGVEPAPPAPVVAAPVSRRPAAAAPAPASESWIDWVTEHWWVPAAVLAAALIGLLIAAWRRRQASLGSFPGLDPDDLPDARDPTAKLGRGRDDSFVVEESGERPMPDFNAAPQRFGEATSDLKAPEDTMSSESAVNLDQGDPLAEADFHMAYGLYDQAADLVRIALEREPDRRDLRMKLLEIYFVWGNKDAFLQTAKSLEATRDRAPAGEWDKIVIMGKQICPDEPLFAGSAGSGRGAGALVDLNLEGGENRVDIDLFGDPEGEHSNNHALANSNDDHAATGESPRLHGASDLDFTLDSPERGADDSPTREMPPRDEPTVESEMMRLADSPTAESPTLKTRGAPANGARGRIASKLASNKADQTAEVAIDDLGLDLDHLGDNSSPSLSGLAETDHPSDAPTMVAGLDARSRRMMAEAESRSRDKDLTELERELEASFVADLGPEHDEIKTAVLGPESAPTVQMPRGNDFDPSATSRLRSGEFSDIHDPDRDLDRLDIDSTSKLRGLNADSIDLDLDRLASALGSGDTVQQPRAEDELFSNEVFEASQRSRVDLDVGDALNGTEAVTNKLRAITTRTTKVHTEELALPELEPVTMSEVGTKLDLARAYMDMGDPEGARSILEEVVTEGSTSQKQEAQRLIETLPG